MDVFFSDFDSYSDSSSSDDQEHNEFIYGGQASCILSNLEETIGKIDDFLLFERGYVHGDIVFATNNPSQMGKVNGIDITVDLENVHGNKLKDINSKKLKKIRSISPGDYVVNRSWIGKIEKIVDFVTILFDDGTKCEFSTMEDDKNIKIIPLSQDFLEDSQYPYYPGQRVKVMISSKSKSTRWFFGTQKVKHDEGTICAVRAGSAYVNWLGCASFGTEKGSEKTRAPEPLQSSKDLIFLSCFSHSSWQIGDWCMISKTHENPRNLPQNNTINPKFQPSFQEIYVIEKTKTKVDVLWQDGSESFGLDSNSLAPVNVIDAHDFWPHQFILEKGTFDDKENRKWGVVKSFDATEKTVVVKWENSLKMEIVSAYELIEHPDYSFFYGDLVFRMNEEQLCCIGIVIGFENGEIEVKWASGFISKVAPHEIFRVEKTEGISADENLDPNQEKSEHDNLTVDPGEKDFLDIYGDDKDCLKSLCDSTTFNVPRAAVGFLSSFAARLFGSPYTSLSAASDHISENGSISDFDFEDDSQKSKVNETEAFKDVYILSGSKNPKEVKQFDMVSDCSNHHFADGAGKGLISSQVKRGWLKKVQQEWKILEKDLPETIYVRVFEERMDLIRAAIVGAPGTPYHDGLFIFDIFLPPQYPHEPPMVHYNSGGLRVNPNLYESGKICLSLLNTWSGTGTETWNPNGSTILQVLVSLQALVLNQNPYFNEAGYDRQVGSAEGEKNSCSYNENAFLMSCKSMIYTLRNPPKHFEALVEEHFAQRCKCILMACKAYLEGVPIGRAFANEHVDPKSQKSNSGEPGCQKSNSTGFKIMLSKLIPKLVEAFTEKGIDCSTRKQVIESLEGGKSAMVIV